VDGDGVDGVEDPAPYESTMARSPQLLTFLLLASLPGCAREPRRTPAAGPTSTAEVAATGAPAQPVAPLGRLAAADELTLLTPEAHLVRIAVALRGVRPGAAELAAVRADPAALGGIVDGYLDSPEFGAVVRDMWNEELLLRVDVKRFMLPALGPLKDRGGDAEYLDAIPEEPLRLIEYVAVNDRPFSEIVTADYTIASELGITAWGATPEHECRRAGRRSRGTPGSRWPASSRAARCGCVIRRTAPTTAAARPS